MPCSWKHQQIWTLEGLLQGVDIRGIMVVIARFTKATSTSTYIIMVHEHGQKQQLQVCYLASWLEYVLKPVRSVATLVVRVAIIL